MVGFAPLAAVLTLAAVASLAAAAEHGPAWSYNRAASATNGPARWASIAEAAGQEPAYPACGLRAQSPINIVNVTVDHALPPLSVSWAPLTRINVTNNGHTVQFAPLANGGGGTATDPATGRSYRLLQLHFHSASEHLFGGSARDLEMHLVHQDPNTKDLLVIGISLTESEVGFNAELANVWDAVTTATASGSVVTGPIDLAATLPPSGAYYTYDGSLTTPPCSEGVRWIVMADPIGVSSTMLSAMRRALGADTMSWPGVSSFVPRGNYRPAQPLNGRVVRAWIPGAAPSESHTAAVDSAMRAAVSGAAMGAIAIVLAVALAVKVFSSPVPAPEKKFTDLKE